MTAYSLTKNKVIRTFYPEQLVITMGEAVGCNTIQYGTIEELREYYKEMINDGWVKSDKIIEIKAGFMSGNTVKISWSELDPSHEEIKIESVTEKAFKVKGQWFPLSGFEPLELRYSIKAPIKCNNHFVLKAWFTNKINNKQMKALGFME